MDTLIKDRLQTLSDSDYKSFNHRIIPTDYEMLGVRMPVLKNLAKEIAKHPEVEAYLDNAHLRFYEEVLLYGLVLASLKNLPLDTTFRYLDPLILKFDNWAHVDTVISSFKSFGKYQEEVMAHFLPLKTHEGEFARRSFVILLMDYFMDDKYIDQTLQHLTEVPQGPYYVDMGIAWALSVGLVKYYHKTFPLLEQQALTRFVHNKAIQKARESYRISPEVKERLKSMKM